MSTTPQKLKILALHGHAMSGELLRGKIGAIRTDTKKLAEWYFPDAPISIPHVNAFSHSPDAPLGKKEDATENRDEESPPPPAAAAASLYSWYDFSKINHAAVSEEVNSFTSTATVDEVKEPMYVGMAEAMEHLGAYCQKHGPFDVLFSFSQGTILAALMCCQLNLHRRQQLASGGVTAVEVNPEVALLAKRLPVVPALLEQPFQCAIFGSGLPAKDPYYTQILQHPGFAAPVAPTTTIGASSTAIRSLHMWGAADDIISPAWSQILMQYPVFVGSQFDGGPGDNRSGGDDADSKRDSKEEEGPEASSVAPQLTTKVNALVEWASHDGGHVVASSLRKPIKAFLQSMLPEPETKKAVGKGGKQPKEGKKNKADKQKPKETSQEEEGTGEGKNSETFKAES